VEEEKRIWTIGHSTLPIDDFLEILKAKEIEILVDVRRFPRSRKNPQFERENLRNKLRMVGIEYHWLGDLLGGFRKGGYKNYMLKGEFQRGIERLIQIAREGKTTIMCAEKLWFRCHRRFISDRLHSLGIEVIHIVNKKKAYRHKI